jgi:hypothetical protein
LISRGSLSGEFARRCHAALNLVFGDVHDRSHGLTEFDDAAERKFGKASSMSERECGPMPFDNGSRAAFEETASPL